MIFCVWNALRFLDWQSYVRQQLNSASFNLFKFHFSLSNNDLFQKPDLTLVIEYTVKTWAQLFLFSRST